MGLAIAFTGADGVEGTEFTLTGDDGEIQLPRLRIASGQPDTWVERCSILSCTGDGLTPALRDAITGAWQASADPGPLPLQSRTARFSAAAVTGPARLRVEWEVSYRDEGIYAGYFNDADPQLARASVRLTLESTRSKEARSMAIPGPVHKGHVAVDFGTSNCTVTLLDIEELPTRVLSLEQVRKLRQGLLALMNDPDRFGPDARPEFESCLSDVASVVLDDMTSGPEALHRRLLTTLSGEDDREPRLLYAALVALERKVNSSSADLRPRLASTLAGLYTDAWRVPPLDRLRLFPVVLDVAAGAVEIESKVSVTRDPWQVVVGRPVGIVGPAGAGAPVVYAGLKQRLGQTRPYPELGDGVTSDTLLRDSLGDLVTRTNDYIASTPRDLGSGRVDSVVITYPTMASPAVRHKLRNMLTELGISRVDTSYDEAIAAAMFFLLRDFGGDHDMGLEVLRARCRRTGRPDQWVQNMLVIDIGGGTADIALLTLTLADTTPDGLDPRRHGRYYEVRPEVRGSTGRLQQGGELTTLRVFYWLKAAIADRLLASLPDRFKQQRSQLDQLSLGELGEDPLTRWTAQREPSDGDPLFKILDAIVPTRSKDGAGHPGPTFWVLWSLAEQKKLELCRPGSPARTTVSALEVRNVLRSVDQGSEAEDPLEPTGLADADLEIEFTAEKFESLVAADIDDVIGAALGLVEERLSKGETPEPLDRVILTGQASKAPLVRRLVQERFTGSEKGKSAPRCSPSAIVVEDDYAKRATSVGACWARSIQGLGRSPDGARRRLEKGHNELYLDVKNLFFHLPCAFSLVVELGSGGSNVLEILSTGQELYQLSPDGTEPAVRSDWFELAEYFDIFRKGQGNDKRWGAFRWEADLAGGADLDRGVWPRQILGSVEANSTLDLHLLLCRGDTRHYLMDDGPSISALRGDAERGGRWLRGSRDNRQPIHPGDIEVNAYGLDGTHQGDAVFPQARGQDADDPPFPEYFHPSGEGMRSTVFRGLIGRPLPEPPRDGTWTFHYRDASGTLHRIGELTPPPRTSGLRANYIPSLDEYGNLRVHDCAVPYWPASSALEVQNFPGSVLRVPVDTPPDQEIPAKDPFNGIH